MDEPPKARPKVQPYHLTPEQLRLAYQEPPIDDIFARLADTRLAMLRKEEQRRRWKPEVVS